MSDNVAITEGSGKTIASDDVGGIQYQLIKPAFGVDGAATLVSSSDPLPVVGGITGSVGVYFSGSNPSVSVSNAPTITGITNSVGVFFSGSNPSVNVGTPTIAGITGSVGVFFSGSNPSVNVGTPTVAGITASVGVFFSGSNPSVNPSIAFNSGVTGATTTRVVHVTDVGSSVQLMAGTAIAGIVGLQTTASIFTASGSAAGVTTSGNTIISPSANASFKIFAFSVQTTAAVSLVCKFTNGSGASPTEFFRPLVTAAGVTGAQGANLATRPGAPLFVTGVSTTLSLVLDSASLVHYSVSYTKESA